MSRIALIGAGGISAAHAQALATLPGHAVACVVDPDHAAARRRAAACGPGVGAFATLGEALAAEAFDRAHVLVPPALHAEIGATLLRAGKPVLLEKPLAAGSAACATLLAAAREAGVALGVNQNFVHHPAFARLRALVEGGALGPLRFVQCVYHVPLRQMAARQFGHWMFAAPVNILLEQAVHPLSQVQALAGPIGAVQAIAGEAMALAPGRAFHPTLTATLAGSHVPAQLRFAVGQAFPFWQVTAVCDDGAAVADILANRLHCHRRTRWMAPGDALLSGLATAGGIARDSVANAATFALATLKLRGRGDPFFVSMRESIAAFHRALDAGAAPALDGAFGAGLVATCERLAQAAGFAAPPPRLARSARAAPACDVAVLGGTGFIGAHSVAALLASGRRVAVMARSVDGLPAPFDDPRVALHRGDIRDAAAVRRAIAGVRAVVNLAHGGGGESFAAIRDAMLGGAEVFARACLDGGVTRAIHVGSIASLYLGPGAGPITAATPPDPYPDRRADYARAKVLCDRMLLALHRETGLPVVILRPGLVVGGGSSPFHSGLGAFNTEQHCLGWNAGRNALPFVLVQDVAAAIVAAIDAAGVEGRCYNLVGDVRLSAREYIAALAAALRRPLAYHPQRPLLLLAEEGAKYLVKRVTGRAAGAPSLRDLRSRGLAARFDIPEATRDLGWRPVGDRETFFARAIGVHARP